MASGNGRNRQEYALVTRDDPKSPAAEAYRTLRTNLQFAALDTPLRVLLITSVGPGEGKTTTAANLGIAMAQSGSKVIVIGGDLRKPTLHYAFELRNTVGLTNVLTGAVSWEDALQPTDVDGLFILPAGPIPPNPAELLASKRMQELLEELKGHCDVVIIDAPPVLAVTDAGVLSRMADGVLLVVHVGVTPREVAKAAKDQLLQVGARLLGLVVNGLSGESGYYYYYYHRYYSLDDQPGGSSWIDRLKNRLGAMRRRVGPASAETAAGRDR